MTQYIHGHGPGATKAHARRNVANSAGHLVEVLEPGMKVLDLGAASGALTRALAARVAPGKVIGVDLSADAVEQAQADPLRPANLVFEVGDVYALPYPAASFDLVHVHQVLHHLADPVVAIRNLAMLVRPGGWLSLREADFGAAFWYPEATAWESWRQAYQLVARGGGTEVDAGRRILAWLDRSGLAGRAKISGSIWTYPGYESAAEVAANWAERLTERRFIDLAAGLGVADETSLIRTAAGLVEWASHPGAMFAMPHVEALVSL
ncbi:MAG: class I SAM-dependent methyltransferase [Bifidobacteriaceae bacterium]|jgi:SAM-dependent methyltransferase|nr:class I SAM-dependent methyltransferase [Bifidobacteriaceae bacterium]